MPGTVFLPNGGIMGSLLAFVFGGIVMAAIAMNYHYLASLCPGRGGLFYLLQNTMNRQHAFAASWAMCFAYMVIIPLNARALAWLVKALLAEYFQIEFHLSFFGSGVMVFDFVVVTLVLVLFAWINAKGIRLTGIIQTVLAVILLGGIATLFVMALCSGVPIAERMTPAYYPGRTPLMSFLIVFIMIPWAFVGFDSVPALSREIRFSRKKLALVMILAVAAGTFGYMANVVITVMGVSPDYAGWVDYTRQAGSLEGLDSIAVVGAARAMYGMPGTLIALVTLLAGILSGPNGTIAMISRLVYCMSRSNSLFPSLSKTNEQGVPYRAINFAVFVSLVMTLIAISFNTMELIASACTAFGYGCCSLSVLLKARGRKKPLYVFTGGFGLLTCMIWFVLLLIPVEGIGSTFSGMGYAYLALWVFAGIWIYAFTCRRPNTILDD